MKLKYLMVIFILFLVGCNNVEIDKEKFIHKIDEKFEDMLEISNQELTNYYGLNTDMFIDYVFKVSKNDPINIYILVLPKNKSKAKKEINNFLDKLAANCSKNCQKRIKDKYYNTYDDYLFYIVSDHNKDIYKEMKELFKK